MIHVNTMGSWQVGEGAKFPFRGGASWGSRKKKEAYVKLCISHRTKQAALTRLKAPRRISRQTSKLTATSQKISGTEIREEKEIGDYVHCIRREHKVTWESSMDPNIHNRKWHHLTKMHLLWMCSRGKKKWGKVKPGLCHEPMLPRANPQEQYEIISTRGHSNKCQIIEASRRSLRQRHGVKKIRCIQ